MDKIDIKDIQGNLRFSTIINKEGKRRFYLMKEDYITLKFSVDDPVYFQLGDYAEYDNELFEKLISFIPLWINQPADMITITSWRSLLEMET